MFKSGFNESGALQILARAQKQFRNRAKVIITQMVLMIKFIQLRPSNNEVYVYNSLWNEQLYSNLVYCFPTTTISIVH